MSLLHDLLHALPTRSFHEDLMHHCLLLLLVARDSVGCSCSTLRSLDAVLMDFHWFVY
jgi:hypothetical protein